MWSDAENGEVGSAYSQNRGRPQCTRKGGGRVRKDKWEWRRRWARSVCSLLLSPGRRQSGVSRVRDCLGPETWDELKPSIREREIPSTHSWSLGFHLPQSRRSQANMLLIPMARFLLSARNLQCDINFINSWIVLCCICLSRCLRSPAKVLFLWTFPDSLYQARSLARQVHLCSHMGQTRLVSDCQQFLTKEGCELRSRFLIWRAVMRQSMCPKVTSIFMHICFIAHTLSQGGWGPSTERWALVSPLRSGQGLVTILSGAVWRILTIHDFLCWVIGNVKS